MTETRPTCPCCGQATPDTGIVVNLEENRLYFNGKIVKLTARLAELAFILARRSPETVPHERIIAQMWGNVEPDYASTSIKVAISQLRPKLRAVGLRIENIFAHGYRMEVVPAVSKTERTGFSTVTGEDFAHA